MNPVKILIIFQLIFKLQSIRGVMAYYQLLPSYRIPDDDLPNNFTVPAVNECIAAYRYSKDGNKTYLGFNALLDKYIYSEVNKKFNSDDKCIFHSASVLESISMFYTNKDYFLLIIRGCLGVSMIRSPEQKINGTFVLLPTNWTEEFLNEGLSHFNISHSFDKANILHIANNRVNQCYYIQDNCLSYKTETADCFDGFSGNNFLFFYISLLVFVVVFIVAGIWYYRE